MTVERKNWVQPRVIGFVMLLIPTAHHLYPKQNLKFQEKARRYSKAKAVGVLVKTYALTLRLWRWSDHVIGLGSTAD